MLEAGAGDVSLLPRIGWTQWKVHRDHGVTDRAALAGLGWRTACAVATGVDLAGLRAVAAGRPPDAPLWISRTPGAVQDSNAPAGMGIATVGDRLGLADEATAAYSGSNLASLPEQIDLARAALAATRLPAPGGVRGGGAARGHRGRRRHGQSSEVGVYLWGNLLTERYGSRRAPVRPLRDLGAATPGR